MPEPVSVRTDARRSVSWGRLSTNPLFAVGSKGGTPTKTSGQVWYEQGGEWVPLENSGNPTGFEPDDLGDETSIWQALEYGDDVVFFGSDIDQAGLWTISKADLLAAVK